MKASVTCLVFSLGLAGHGHADVAPPGETVYQATRAADGLRYVRIEGGAYFFRPSQVIVKSNLPIEQTVSVDRNVIPHSVVIEAPEAGIAVDGDLSSQSKKSRFTPAAMGSYPFYGRTTLLLFESHREKGMEGVLEGVD